jgi:hypothetical protein
VSESSTKHDQLLERIEQYPAGTLLAIICPKEQYASLAARVRLVNPGLVVEWVERRENKRCPGATEVWCERCAERHRLLGMWLQPP